MSGPDGTQEQVSDTLKDIAEGVAPLVVVMLAVVAAIAMGD